MLFAGKTVIAQNCFLGYEISAAIQNSAPKSQTSRKNWIVFAQSCMQATIDFDAS